MKLIINQATQEQFSPYQIVTM